MKPKLRKITTAVATVAAIAVAASIAWNRWHDDRSTQGLASGDGRIEATAVSVATKQPGRIDEILVGEGDFVKAGQVVALNRTSELLKAASGSVLQFKTDTALPPALAAVARVTGRIVQLPAHDAAEIENHLAALRVAGVEVQDMEIRRPDLEDVFLQVMSGTSASNLPLEGVAL